MRTVSLVTGAMIAIALTLGSGRAPAAPPPGPPGPLETVEIGLLAYVYGYPLVVLEVSKQVATNVPDATTAFGRAPINQFSNNLIPDASFTDIVLPSVSTPYSNAFLDLAKRPVILHLPDLGDRFFLMQVMDGWTNVGGLDPTCLEGGDGFCGLGSRYGTGPGDYAFVGPGWKGTLPPGIEQVVRMPTDTAWIAGRTLTTGTPEDLAAVATIQEQYTLTPLQHYGKRYTLPAHAPVNPKIDMTTPPRDQVANMDAGTFFKMLANLMGPNPPAEDDAFVIAQLAKVGIVPGRPFEIRRLDPATRRALEEGYAKGQELVAKEAQQLNLTSSNWSMSLDLGVYGHRYLERAAVAYGGLGANLYLDAVYAGAIFDAECQPTLNVDCDPLDGSQHRYVVHFEADGLPPVDPRAFWSVTLYNRPLENLFDNEIGRYALGIPAAQGHLPCFNDDGSLDLYIQAARPADDTSIEFCNWLPAPEGEFLLLLRMYWPGPELFQATDPWVPPAVQRLPL
ncbi:MAG TPA: DUF1254 domain-containing protein [Geminicoccaceae bacterium]|nr:DUF1254 domain-containing protein [Geminicoccaceae bacterium]